jgi:hypothetical protein
MMKATGARVLWLTEIADAIMDGGASPPSFSRLCLTVPGRITTAVNDGHNTAAAAFGEARRDDYLAGQKVIVEEMLQVLREQGFINGDNEALRWLMPVDGTWTCRLAGNAVTLRGQAERRRDRDRGMLGERLEDNREQISLVGGLPGRFAAGTAPPIELDLVGPRGGIERVKLEVHPLAMKIPPMTQAERETLRASIARDGVKIPIVLFQKKILDGRNRGFLAAQLGKPVKFEEFKGSEEEAARFVITVNIARRHLNVLQQALYVRELFEPAARQKATQRRQAKVGRPKKLPPNLGGNFPTSDKENEWPAIASEDAAKAGLDIPATAFRAAAELQGAPKALAEVAAGNVTSAHEARRRAAEEKGQELDRSELSVRSVNKRLGLCITQLNAILADCQMPLGAIGDFDAIEDRLRTIHRLASEVEDGLKRNRVIG